MQKACPTVEFIPVPAVMDDMSMCPCNECEYMRMNTLEKLHQCLRDESNEIFVDEKVAKDAIVSIQRMLEMS
jgi:quinolinate synthase